MLKKMSEDNNSNDNKLKVYQILSKLQTLHKLIIFFQCYKCLEFGHMRRDCNEIRRKRQNYIKCFNCGSDSHTIRYCLERKDDPLNLKCGEIKINNKILPLKYTEQDFEYDIKNKGGFEAIQIFSSNYDLNIKKIEFKKIKNMTFATVIIPDINFRLINYCIPEISKTQMKKEVAIKLHRKFYSIIRENKKSNIKFQK
jgi:hypothetical protein